jgi:hypothetical protein
MAAPLLFFAPARKLICINFFWQPKRRFTVNDGASREDAQSARPCLEPDAALHRSIEERLHEARANMAQLGGGSGADRHAGRLRR